MFRGPSPFHERPKKSDADLRRFCENYRNELQEEIKRYLVSKQHEKGNKNFISEEGLPGLDVKDASKFNDLQKNIANHQEIDVDDFVNNIFKETGTSINNHRKLWDAIIKYKALNDLLLYFDKPKELRKAYLNHHPFLSPYRAKDEKITPLLSYFSSKLNPPANRREFEEGAPSESKVPNSKFNSN